MELILWRHADAEPGEPDLDRALSATGVRQAERVGAWLDARLPRTARVLVSPAHRAQQTARTLRREFRIVSELAPGASVGTVLGVAGWPDAREPSLIVGHQPTLGATVAWLLSGVDASWSIVPGALWWLSGRMREHEVAVAVKAVIAPDCV